MILKGISVNQNPPTKDYLWITPKGNTRFWDQSTWRSIGRSGGGETNLPDITAAGKYLITAGISGDYYTIWGDLNLNGYINGDVGYAAVFNGSNSITSAKLTNSKIRIGDGILEWDSTNKGFKIYNATSTQETPTTAGIYADWVSALGPNSSGGGGGGGDLDWGSLITWDEDLTHKININYLPISLNDGTITIGNNSITPLTSHQDISGKADKTITITGTNGLSGGGTLEQNRTIGIDSIYKSKIDEILSMFELDSNGDVKTKDKPNNGGHRGFYSESFISALGANSSGGGGGDMDVARMWKELTDNPSWSQGDSTVITIAHGGTGRSTTANGAWYTTAANQSSVTIGTLPLAQGGIGRTSSPTITVNLDSSSTGTTLLPSSGNVSTGVTGTLPVGKGGTGATSFTSGALLIGNGTSAVGTRSITNNTSANNISTGTNIPTMNTIYYGLPTINNSHSYTSSYNIYAPTSGGTNGYILKANGSTSTPTWLDILPIANGGTGQTTAKDACNAFINALSTGASTPTDSDYYVSQYVNGGTTTTTYHRRPVSALWSYIKSKMSSDSAVNISGNAATATVATKLGTSNVGSLTNPIYLSSGIATACTYSLSSTVNGGTANRLAYYSSANTIDDATYIGCDGTRLCVGGNVDANYVFKVANGRSYAEFYPAVDFGSNAVGFNARCRYTPNGLNGSNNFEATGLIGQYLGSANNTNIDCYGIKGLANNDGTYHINGKCVGIQGYAYKGNTNYGVQASLSVDTSSTTNRGFTTYLSGTPASNSTNIGINVENLFSAGTNYGIRALVSGATSGTNYAVYANATGGTNNWGIYSYRGKNYFYDSVGIGTTSPAYKLDINGNIHTNSDFYLDNTKRLYIGNNASTTVYKDAMCLDSGNAFIIGNGTSASSYNTYLDGFKIYLRTNTNHQTSLYINESGDVGIGNTSPDTKLHVSGNIYATGGVTALQAVSSDRRLKKNIKNFNAKDIIDKLNPVEFEWNSKAKKLSDFQDGKNYGLIAQDSDNIIDNFVFDLPDGKGYKGVRYEKLIPILLQAVKEQQKEIDELKQIIKKLKV